MTSPSRRTFIAAGASIASTVALASTADASTTAAASHSTPNDRPKSGYQAFTIENSGLVLIDHQVGTIDWAAELTPEERPQIKLWARTIARFAKGAGMPIVLTSSLENEHQGPLLPEFEQIMPQEYAARIKRTGIINAWEDPNFANAVRRMGKRNLLMSGLTTDVCLVPPALSAKAEGFNVVALFDSSGACTKQAAENSRALLTQAGIPIMTTTPMITSMLGNYKNPASKSFFDAYEAEGIYQAFAKGGLR